MLKTLVWLHRWLGIALCLLFAMWFASGAVLFFVPFPSLDKAEARTHAAPVALDRVALSPMAALARMPGALGLRLVQRGGTPAYVASTDGGDLVLSAVDGYPLRNLTPGEAGAIASEFAGRPIRAVSGPLRYDQWVVHQAFDHARPFYRVALADPAATELYVSATTGEVVQKTTGFERTWNWPGAVMHWLYVTPLRRVFAAWDQTVWWVSLAGVLMAVIGMGLGVYRSTRKLHSRRPAISPFQGWLKWHHLLGLTGGVVVLTWIFSGWLSMDHGRLFPRAGTPAGPAGAYAAAPLRAVAGQIDNEHLQALKGVTSVAFTAVAGHPVVSGLGPQPPQILLNGSPLAVRVPTGLIQSGLQLAYPGAKVSSPEVVTSASFYARAEGVDTGADVYRVSGPGLRRVFVEPATGALLAQVDRRRALYDWVYYGLHTFNVPGLMGRPILRIIVVLPLLASGFALCLTGVFIGVRRLLVGMSAQGAL